MQEGDECFLYIGNNNDIREYASIHRSSKPEDTTVCGTVPNLHECPVACVYEMFLAYRWLKPKA